MSLHDSQFTGFYNLFVQVFLDIVESVNLLMSSKGEETVFQSIFDDYFIFSISLLLTINLVILGSVLRCDVTGKILMKCFLSGMPDLKLGLNDKIGLEKESQLKSRPTKRLDCDSMCVLSFYVAMVLILLPAYLLQCPASSIMIALAVAFVMYSVLA